MNLVNYEVTGMEAAYAAVKRAADALSVEVVSTEIVGLVPEKLWLPALNIFEAG